MRVEHVSMQRLLQGFLIIGILIGGLISLQAAPPGESPPPKISKVTPVSFFAEWATWPQADASTHYQLRLGTALYGGSTLNGWMEAKSLTPGMTYRVAVQTYHQGALVDVSSSAIVLLAAPTPRLVKAWDIGSTSVTISWEPVPTAIEYRVLVDEALVTTVIASETRVRLSGFKPGQRLSVTVVAVNESGASSPSKPLLVSLMPAAPALHAEATEIGQTDFTLRWSAVDGASSYTVALGSGTPFSLGSGTLSWHFAGLTAGASYTVKVVAQSLDGGLSQPGELVVQMIPPTPPVPQASAITNSSFMLEWAPCRGAERYKVFYAGEYMLANVSASITKTLCRPFGPGEVASMTVVAGNSSGDSPQSPTLLVTMTGTPTRFLGSDERVAPVVGAKIPTIAALQPSPLIRELAAPWKEYPVVLLFPMSSVQHADRELEAIRDCPDLQGVRVIMVEPRLRKQAILPTICDPHDRLRGWLFGNSVGDGYCFLDSDRRLRSWGTGFSAEELSASLLRAFPEWENVEGLMGQRRAKERTRFQTLFEVR